MQTDKWVNGACNGHEISNLSVYYGKAQMPQAMDQWFEQEVKKPHNRYAAESAKGRNYSEPAAHYVFSSGAESYGKNFAEYILENKLGQIATLGMIENKKYHPGRTCQIWIWAPDKAALIKWWEKNHPVKVEGKVKADREIKRNPDGTFAQKEPEPVKILDQDWVDDGGDDDQDDY